VVIRSKKNDRVDSQATHPSELVAKVIWFAGDNSKSLEINIREVSAHMRASTSNQYCLVIPSMHNARHAFH